MSPTPSAPVEEPHRHTVDIEVGNHANLGFREPEGGQYDPQATPQSYSASPQPLQASVNAGSTLTSIITKHREKRMEITNIVLRSVALLFSFLSFVIMASNNHYLVTTVGILIETLLWSFNAFGEYSYCFSVALIASVYLALQLAKAIYELITRRIYTFFYYIDFICDQILAYLLMSSASAAAVRTHVLNNQNGGATNIYTDMAAASVSMAFLSCLFVAISSVLSGYNLWKRTSSSL
jgi:hypothetical protein